jgi:hypothetical protein
MTTLILVRSAADRDELRRLGFHAAVPVPSMTFPSGVSRVYALFTTRPDDEPFFVAIASTSNVPECFFALKIGTDCVATYAGRYRGGFPDEWRRLTGTATPLVKAASHVENESESDPPSGSFDLAALEEARKTGRLFVIRRENDLDALRFQGIVASISLAGLNDKIDATDLVEVIGVAVSPEDIAVFRSALNASGDANHVFVLSLTPDCQSIDAFIDVDRANFVARWRELCLRKVPLRDFHIEDERSNEDLDEEIIEEDEEQDELSAFASGDAKAIDAIVERCAADHALLFERGRFRDALVILFRDHRLEWKLFLEGLEKAGVKTSGLTTAIGAEAKKASSASRRPRSEPALGLAEGYWREKDGSVWTSVRMKGKGFESVRLCSDIRAVRKESDASNSNWSMFVEVYGPRKIWTKLKLACDELAIKPDQVVAKLARLGGLRIYAPKSPQTYRLIADALCDADIQTAYMLDKTGWTEINGRLVFALPSGVIGDPGSEETFWGGDNRACTASKFGTFDGWKTNVCNLLDGNPVPTMGLASCWPLLASVSCRSTPQPTSWSISSR